jgi:hypothetical protein
LHGHIHRNTELGVRWPLDRIGDCHLLAGLILEQIDRVRCVVPQQVIGPGSRLTQRVHVGTTKKVGLHIQLQQPDLTLHNLAMQILMRGIEASRMSNHAHQSGFLLQARHCLSIRPAICEGNLHLDVFAGAHALNRLLRMHLRRRTKNRSVNARLRQRFGKIGGGMGDAVFRGSSARRFNVATDNTDHFDPVNVPDRIEMLLTKRAGTSENNFHGVSIHLSQIFQDEMADRGV